LIVRRERSTKREETEAQREKRDVCEFLVSIVETVGKREKQENVYYFGRLFALDNVTCMHSTSIVKRHNYDCIF